MINLPFPARLPILGLSAALVLLPLPKGAQAQPAEDPLLRLTTWDLESPEDNGETETVSRVVADTPADALPAPRRQLPEDEDPYGALGIRAGAFLIYPALEARLGHTDNLNRSSDDPIGSGYVRLLPELEFRSDWSRHALRGRIEADHRAYDHSGRDDTTGIDVELAARVDIRSSLTADFRVSYSFDPESRHDSADALAVVEPADSQWLAGEAVLTRDIGLLRLSTRAAVAQKSYEDTVLSDGTVEDNSDRSYLRSELAVRGSFELVGDTALFVEMGANRRRYERKIDDDGVLRGSHGYEVLAGAEFRLTGVLVGELGAGYQRQLADDPHLPDVEGVIFRGALEWDPTALTKVTLAGSITPEESIIVRDASGARVYAAEIAIQHLLRRNLIATGRLGYSRADYIGSPRRDDHFDVGVEIEYLVNRWLSLLAEARHARFESNIPGEDYEDNRVEIGMRVRR